MRRRIVGAAVVLAVAGAGALVDRYVRHGGMTARQTPPAIERWIAERLVRRGIDDAERGRQNPLELTAAVATEGRASYRARCEGCHGFDGRGVGPTGAGLYPPPPDISGSALTDRSRTDGELHFVIRNGVRNSGMPAWQLPDREIWALVAYLRALPATATPEALAPPATTRAGGGYAGSAACKECHADIHARWSRTLMANVVRDPREHPEAILPDFGKPDPLVTFTPADVALVYGTKWKQRYFKRVDNDYVVLPAQWDVTHAVWKSYFVKDDWWVPLYPPDNAKRPTGPLCDGCHSVGYDVTAGTVVEWNVGCERCHGPGKGHVARPHDPSTIVNPSRLGYVDANDVCVQCHSQGRPRENPIAGRSYDWPVGFEVGGRLADVWALEDHKLGETTFTHYPDGTAHKNRMQGNDYVQSAMYARGVTCFSCHDAHGTDQPSGLRKPASELCLDCHGPRSPNGPRGPTIAAHTHHAETSPGSACVACHMPAVAQTLGDVNVKSHTFRFVFPSTGDREPIPNACTLCHANRVARLGERPADPAERTPAWAAQALRRWRDVSPWRAGP